MIRLAEVVKEPETAIDKIELAASAVWSAAWYRQISRLLVCQQVDIVHVHNFFPSISPSLFYACRKVGVPVVHTLHNYRLLCPAATLYRNGRVCEDCVGKTWPWPGVVHGCYHGNRAQTAVVGGMLGLHGWLGTWAKQVDLFIALTDFMRRKFISGGLPGEKIVVKPNFVDPDPGVSDGSGQYALFVGRLSPEKGLQTLLRAWQFLGDVPLKIVGDGPLMPEVRATISSPGRSNVQALGQVSHDDSLRIMKAARFVVFPSECYEGFGLVLCEAFACGVPVIASGLGASNEVVDDHKTGLLFKPGSVEDLTAKVDWAWNHPAEMREMGLQARKEYDAKYTAERNHELLLRIYERAMGQRLSTSYRSSDCDPDTHSSRLIR